MNTIIISYDLNNHSKRYDELYATIKEADGWWHYLDSFWIIKTGLSVNDWTEKLKQKIDKRDSLLVVEVSVKESNGWLPKDAWDWLRENTNIG